MAVVNKIKAQAYCDHFERASDNIYAVKKNRPFDIHGVYKATEAYEVELTLDDVIDNEFFNECNILPQDDFFKMMHRRLTCSESIN